VAALRAWQMMTAKEFRCVLGDLGLTQIAAADLLGISERQIRNYAIGYTPVPEAVAILLRLTKAGRIRGKDIEAAKT
jgi:hypothetical protein